MYDQFTIYALALKESPSIIQGLVALQDIEEAQIILLHWAVAAPHNNPQLHNYKQFIGVGGHLFAIALYESLKKGYGGVVIGHPSSKRLYEHYQEKLHAKPWGGLLANNHQYTIILANQDARYVYEKYDFTDETKI